MHLGIYKPGQGYWVRVMTAVVAGVLVLATAVWMFDQMVRVPIPTRHWTILVQAQTGDIAPGDTLSFYKDADDAEASTPKPIASGTLQLSREAGNAIELQVIDVVVLDKNYDPINAKFVDTPGGFAGVTTQTSIAKVQMFEQIYLQGAVAAVAMLLGAFVVYFLVAAKPGSVDFLISTDGEMKKVNWSTKRDVYRSTLVVISCSLIIASGLFVVDTVFAAFFRFVNVLQ